jgi:nitric oxide dioxygenase
MAELANDSSAVLERSLYAVAEAGEDITPVFFKRFFALHPDQEQIFFQPDQTCGVMVNEILDSLLALDSNEGWVSISIQNLVAAHRCYGDFPLSLYQDVLDVFVATLAELAGDRWSAEFDAAWRRVTGELYALIAKTL